MNVEGMDLDSYTSGLAERYGQEPAGHEGEGLGRVDPQTPAGQEAGEREGYSAGAGDAPYDAVDDENGAEPGNALSVPRHASDYYDARNDDGEIIQEGGDNEYDDFDDLPLFANEQSKALHREVKQRQVLLESLEKELAGQKERVQIMDEHLKNVVQEVGHTNGLLAAKRKETETERHLEALSQREIGRYMQEIRRMETGVDDLQVKLNGVQNSMFSANERMDQFKLQMNWNQEELEQWALAAQQKEDDSLALLKYSRADEVRCKELAMELERLSKAVVERRATIESMRAASSAKQVELDRTAESYRSLHSERQDLIKRWQDAIDTMRRRDEEINAMGDKYAGARDRRTERYEVLQQNIQRLKMQQEDNSEVQARIDMLERVVANKRGELIEQTQALGEFKDELGALRNALGAGAAELAETRRRQSALEKQVEDQTTALEAARARYQASKRMLGAENSKTQSAEQSVNDASQLLQQRQAELKRELKAMEALKAAMFRDSQRLYSFRKEEAALIADISGGQATLKNLQGKVHKLDQDQLRQQELIYTAEFQIQQMERKVARGLGERSDEEKIALRAQIKELEAELEQKSEEKRGLAAQVRNLTNELKVSVRRRDGAKKQEADLAEGLNELNLECAAAEKCLAKAMADKEENMVQTDMIRLEVKRLQDILSSRTDEVFSLENRRQQLHISMEERKSEIAAHREAQRAAYRIAEEERHRVQLELTERRQVVDRLHTKYEVLHKGFALPEGLADAGRGGGSQAYFVIAAAQRREELQRKGDALDAAISKAEREMRALSSTLQHLHARNVDLRLSFAKVDPTGVEAEKLRELEAQEKVVKDSLFRARKSLHRLHADFDEDGARLSALEEQALRLRREAGGLEQARRQAEEEVETAKAAAAKAAEKLEERRQLLRQEAGVQHETLTEKKLRAEALQEAADVTLERLAQLAQEFPEIAHVLHTELKFKNISMVNVTAATASSRRRGSSRSAAAIAAAAETMSARSTSSRSSRASSIKVRQMELAV